MTSNGKPSKGPRGPLNIKSVRLSRMTLNTVGGGGVVVVVVVVVVICYMEAVFLESVAFPLNQSSNKYQTSIKQISNKYKTKQCMSGELHS